MLMPIAEKARAPFAGSDLEWLTAQREAAAAAYRRLGGLPTPRVESWKYTSLRPLEKVTFEPGHGTDVAIDRLPTLLPHGEGSPRVVLVNGSYRADLSTVSGLPDGVEIGGLADALTQRPSTLAEHLGQIANGAVEDQTLLALNTAQMTDGFYLRVPRGVTIAEPIEVIYLGVAPDAPLAYHPRVLLVLEPNSRATVVEHHAGTGEGSYFSNIATEVFIGAGAQLRHYKVQAEAPAAFHLTTLHAAVARDGFYDSFVLTRGARLSRHEASVRLTEPGAQAHLNGIYMLRDEQHCDNTTVIEHLAPHTSSRETFLGAIDDHGRGVFQGRIVVHPDAQKSDGHQLSKVLLLSDGAEIDAKPELEIYADDVKCSHGATAGDLDPEALFYLRSRGIAADEARHMLIEAFLTGSIRELAAEGLCPALITSIGHWLSDERIDGVQP